ncbi:class IV adenylate cyclase [Candidatus Uhrbacteria bacterium]|nr:class IV adenylate cyclase [Candidatus Uhrbacteria bacterium]
MSRELELKFAVDDLEPVRSKLIGLGAVLAWKGEEENWFFDTSDRRLKASGRTLRLKRQGSSGNRLTVKAKPSEDARYKLRDEYETAVDDIPTVTAILENLGFGESFRYVKNREHWELDGMAIEMDTLNGMAFVEIEGDEPKIDELAGILGLDFGRSTVKSYPQILEEGV